MSDAAGWNRIEAALDELLALPEAQRAAALARLAGDDAAMRTELESLLAETRTPDTLLDQPAVTAYQPQAPAEGSVAPGTRLGAWRIAGLIGRGGMGEVYRAERADGQFEQQVALKLIRRDAAGEPRRFTAERQILARLEHPGIARLLDGGVAEDGRPYMVMELVQGGPITDWCRSHERTLEQRLQLFMAVCEAVAYAHRNLVIHRDLKPGNVMVTAEGQIKLLDFGIAKLLAPGGAVDPEQTRHVPLTLGYAAPEQLAGGAVTTAADVYALGMLLYELLSGRRPWSLQQLSMPAALDKLLREPPPSPSRAAAQGGAPPVPPRLLRGDLDAIVARALRKEPEKRYATVEALREDVARHLAGEPVAAREGARLYAFSRFVGRNRLMVGAAALLLLAIVGGSLGIAWQARRAELEARKATAVKDFLVGIFNANGRDNPDGAKARLTTAQQLLDLGAKRIHGEMQDVPEVRAELLGTIGGLYADLELSDQAIGLLQEQVDTLRRLNEGKPSYELATAEVTQGAAQAVAEHFADAQRTLTEALDTMDLLGDHDSVARARALYWLGHIAYRTRPTSDFSSQLYESQALTLLESKHPQEAFRSTVLMGLGRIAALRRDFVTAETRYRQALALEQNPSFARRPADLAEVLLELGETLQFQQRYSEAEAVFRQSVQVFMQDVGADYPSALRARQDLGGVLFARGRLAEARPIMVSALQALERVRGVDDPAWTLDARIYLAQLLLARGELAAAAPLLNSSITALQARAPNHLNLSYALRVQATLLVAEGRWSEAEQDLIGARNQISRILGERHTFFAATLLAELELRLAQGNAESAEELCRRLLTEWPPPTHQLPDSFMYGTLGVARIRLLQGQPAKAIAIVRPLLERILNAPQADSLLQQEAAARFWLGTGLLREHQISEALQHLKRAVVLREQMDDPFSPWLALARIGLAQGLLENGDRFEAQRLLALASNALSQNQRLGPQLREPLRSLQMQMRFDVKS
jgi:tetratricopeptide (TPR) repeat protein